MAIEITLWITGILLSILLTIVLTEPINFLIAKIFGGTKLKENKVSGIWKAVWLYEKEGKRFSIIQYYAVKQFGNYVIASSINDEINPTEIKAKMSNKTFLTGTWVGKFNKDKGRYHGALQFLISPTGNKMNGKWIGFDRNHRINEGDWEWTLIQNRIDKEFVKQLSSEEKEGKIKITPPNNA